jgi:Leucine-rich repeat (LRR) protein
MEILGALPNLKTLWLPCNNLSNLEIAAAIDFPYLEELDLSFNRITPESVLFLSALPALTQLDLSSNQLTRLPKEITDMREWWKNFTGPGNEDITPDSKSHHRRLTDILSAHGRFEQQKLKQEYQRTRASTFSYTSNRYQVSYAMPGFLKLETLNLENNQLTDLDVVDILGSLQSLKTLNLSGNCIVSLAFILERTYSLPEPKTVIAPVVKTEDPDARVLTPPMEEPNNPSEMSSMSDLDDTPKPIAKKESVGFFPSAQELFESMDAVRGSDEGSQANNIKRYLGFPSLEELKLSHNQIGEVEGLMAIVCLSSLKRVYLEGNPVMNPRNRPAAQRGIIFRFISRLQYRH